MIITSEATCLPSIQQKESTMVDHVNPGLTICLPQSEVPLTIRLVSNREGRDDEERVKELSLAVFGRLTSRQRERLVAQWGQLARPQILLSEHWWASKWSDGLVEYPGELTWLNWAKLRQAPDFVVETTLAHEIAHVLQYAQDKHRFALSRNDLSGRINVPPWRLTPENLVEIHADETIMEWGYDPLEGLVWTTQHMVLKEGKWKMRRRPWQRTTAVRKAKQVQANAYYCRGKSD